MKNLPDKIWLNQDHSVWLQDPKSTEYTEYARKDAFIEKASGWLEQALEPYMPYCDIDIDLVIEGFKKYMKQ